jgi:hypothetical protein
MSRPPAGSQEQAIPSFRPRGPAFRPRMSYNDAPFVGPPNPLHSGRSQGPWNFSQGPRGPPMGFPPHPNFGGGYPRGDFPGINRGGPRRGFGTNINLGGRMPMRGPGGPFGRPEMAAPDLRPPFGPSGGPPLPQLAPVRPYQRGGAQVMVAPPISRGRSGKRTGTARQIDEEDVLTVRPLYVCSLDCLINRVDLID